jgi:RNA polymerase sigma-70 factor (ECF subfamily)
MSFKDSDPETLLKQAQAGNEVAFDELYQKFHRGIFRFAWQMSGSRSAAEDILQEVFLVFLQKLHSYDSSRGTLSSYLYGIARKMVMRWLEQNGSQTLNLEYASEQEVADPVRNPLAELSREESILRVRKAILTLPFAYREAVVLCEIQEISYSDAAEVIGCSIGTVRSRLHRARAILLKKLESMNPKSSEEKTGGMSYELSTF